MKHVLFAAWMCSTALVGQSKMSAFVRPTEPDAAIDVIVRYRDGADASAVYSRLAHGVIRRNHDLSIIRSHALTVTARDIAALAADPDVEEILPDNPIGATATGAPAFVGGPDYGWETALDLSGPPAAFRYDGSGISVAVIDSGITYTNDLSGSRGRSRLIYSQNFMGDQPDANDHYGHGNHVAGIIGGNGSSSAGHRFTYQIRGIAPNVNLINLRVLDSNGKSNDSTVIAAIQTAIALKDKYNIRVLNLSVGRPVYASYTTDPLCQAVEKAWQAGIVVVVAAGNEGRNNSAGTHGYATITAPGNDPYVITVGAMNTLGTPNRLDDKMTSYSSKGPTLIDHIVKPDLVAPGNRILSLQAPGQLLDQTYWNNRVPLYVYSAQSTNLSAPDYFQLSGTSMAAPMVSGAAALLLQKEPWLTPDQVKARLMKTATKLPLITTVATDPATGAVYLSQNDIFTVGAGYLDISAALANNDTATGSALSPTAQRGDLGSINLVMGTNAVWGSGVAWGTNAVWGYNAAWGTFAVWGTNTVWGTFAVWGTGSPVSADALTIAINGEN